jgi:putative NIF3 family GTP cyclohydrolase 1 type 2
VGHDTRLYPYGGVEIRGGRVGVCAGGGNDADVVADLIENGVNVLVTGVSVENAHSAPVHAMEKEHGISLLGGTHYSSEKFACIAICGYFAKLGIDAEFVEDVAGLADL